MARSFLKVYFDFDEKTEELNDGEKGRLLLAMYRYAKTAEKPSLTGNERFLFATFKGDIDRDIATYNAKVANGSLGGRPAMNEQNLNKPNDTENNLNKPNETEENLNIKNKDMKNKNKDKDITPKPPKGGGVAFEAFWVAYPRHTNKQAALKAFQRLNPDDVLMQTILKAISLQRQSDQWTRDGGQYIPHPATWLNGRRWEDEMPKGGKTVAAQRYQQRYYTEEELDSLSEDLLEEARKAKDENLLEEAREARA